MVGLKKGHLAHFDPKNVHGGVETGTPCTFEKRFNEH